MKTNKRFHLNSAQKECASLREKILFGCYQNGGHLSSNLGMVETTYSLLEAFDPYENDILFDVGHQTYAYKLLTGRSLEHLRQYQGIAPFSLRKESKADKYDNGHSGDSLPTALGMSLAKHLKGEESATIVVVGDASLNNGLAQEALSLLSEHKELDNFLLIVNSNAMAIKESKDSRLTMLAQIRDEMIAYRLSDEGQKLYSEENWSKYLEEKQAKLLRDYPLTERFQMYGLTYLGPFEGHDLLGLNIAFKKAKKVMKKGPVILEIMTKKGMGYLPSEEDHIGLFHGVKKGFAKENADTFSIYKKDILLSLMKREQDLYLLTPAMETSSSLTEIFTAYPQRTLDVGIAEEDAMAVASGLALKGFHPVVDIYSTFLQRCMDEVIENFSRQNLTGTFLLERASLVGEDGSSHQGIFDVPLLRAVPNARLYMPYDRESLQDLLTMSTKEKKHLDFIRLSKENRVSSTDLKMALPISYLQKENQSKVLYLAVGVMGYQALSRLTLPGDKGILVDLNPQEMISLYPYEQIYFYDPYSNENGVSLNLQKILFKMQYQGQYKAKTLSEKFYDFGPLDKVYEANGVSVEDALCFFNEEKKDD